tara:strand:+ start:58 stop:681 length:624 start_codon:yes stop_codon:yes gene_type:complete
MNIINSNEEFPYILIDDFYNESELEEIWEELDYLCHPRRMDRATIENGGAYHTVDGVKEVLKHNWTMWLDDLFYNNRNRSSILTVNRKLLANTQIFENHPHWAMSDVLSFQRDSTLVAYYENNDEYKIHRDYSRVTCLTWFHREPKKYTGGNLNFPLWDIEIESKNNRVLCFPGAIPHQVTKISMSEEDCGKKLGRFVMSQFLNINF